MGTKCTNCGHYTVEVVEHGKKRWYYEVTKTKNTSFLKRFISNDHNIRWSSFEEQTFTCSNCNKTYVEEVGLNFGDGKVPKELSEYDAKDYVYDKYVTYEKHTYW